MSKTPRGERNNNPGNIDRTTPRTPWQGRVPDSELTDPRFEQFIAPEWGIRALARTIITYQDKHGLNTVAGIIHRWAPPVENDTGSYVAQVTRAVGVSAPTVPIDVQDYATMRALVVSIIKHENGRQPYSAAQIDAGLRLAGVVPVMVPEPPAPIAATKTVTGAVLSAGAGLAGLADMPETVDSASGIVEAAQQASFLATPGGVLSAVLLAIIIGGLALTVYGRWKARQKGGV